MLKSNIDSNKDCSHYNSELKFQISAQTSKFLQSPWLFSHFFTSWVGGVSMNWRIFVLNCVISFWNGNFVCQDTYQWKGLIRRNLLMPREMILGASGRQLIPKWPQSDPKMMHKKHTVCIFSRIFFVFDGHKEDVKCKIPYIRYSFEDFFSKKWHLNALFFIFQGSFRRSSKGHSLVILILNVFQKLKVTSPWHQKIPLD